jgi:hypothetical protein
MTTSRDMAMGRTLLRLYMREMARANQKEGKRKKERIRETLNG